MYRGLLVFGAACGTVSPTVPAAVDASVDVAPDVPFVEAAHAPFPPIPFNGGSVLASANLVVVTFAAYPLVTDIEAMLDWIPTSPWLSTVGAEYGIGTPQVFAKVRLTTTAPSFSSASAFSAYVAQAVGTTVPAPPSKSTFYAFVFPSGAAFSDTQIGSICGSFTGYHDAAAGYTFAAIGTCPNHVPGLTDTEQVERVLSHEVIEALTNPFGDGYAARDPEDPWSYVGGGEVADVCNGYVRQEGFLAVQSWSNAAAAAGQNPCQPSGALYFNVAGGSVQHVAAGAKATITLTGWSTAATADWATEPHVRALSFVPDVTLTTTTMNNGVTSQLTIGVPSSATSGSTALVFLQSLHAGDATYALEPVVVHAQ